MKALGKMNDEGAKFEELKIPFNLKLSRREIEALRWCAEGKTVEDMGLLMSISPETIKKYLDSVRNKLSALNRVHAVAKAIRAGLID